MNNSDHILRDLAPILQRYAPSWWQGEITPECRLFHDLLITGDNILEFWREFDPHHTVNMDGFKIDEFFPSELSWDALVARWYARFGAHQDLLRKYKEISVKDIIELKNGKAWNEIRGNR